MLLYDEYEGNYIEHQPTEPTDTINSIFSNFSGFKNRLIASMVIVKQTAKRNTELTGYPRTSHLAHPNVFLSVECRLKNRMAVMPMISDDKSFSMLNESATKAFEFVIRPTISSTRKNESVMHMLMG
jgi:hypothetical protein